MNKSQGKTVLVLLGIVESKSTSKILFLLKVKRLFFFVATNQSVPSFEGLGSAIMKENNHIFF